MDCLVTSIAFGAPTQALAMLWQRLPQLDFLAVEGVYSVAPATLEGVPQIPAASGLAAFAAAAQAIGSGDAQVTVAADDTAAVLLANAAAVDTYNLKAAGRIEGLSWGLDAELAAMRLQVRTGRLDLDLVQTPHATLAEVGRSIAAWAKAQSGAPILLASAQDQAALAMLIEAQISQPQIDDAQFDGAGKARTAVRG